MNVLLKINKLIKAKKNTFDHKVWKQSNAINLISLFHVSKRKIQSNTPPYKNRSQKVGATATITVINNRGKLKKRIDIKENKNKHNQ